MSDNIYYLSIDNLKNPYYIDHIVYPNTGVSYYWTDDWSPEFYRLSAYLGFISTAFKVDDKEVLLPEIQPNYAVLNWENLHISKTIKKFIRSEKFKKVNYYLKIAKNPNEIIKCIQSRYADNCWIVDKYKYLLTNKFLSNNFFSILSIGLYDNKNKLVAGEIGYSIGSIYTSLSGFVSNDIEDNKSLGTIQLIALGKVLEKIGYSFWNLGHPKMDYKTNLGAIVLPRDKFLKIWIENRDHEPILELANLENKCIFLNKIFAE